MTAPQDTAEMLSHEYLDDYVAAGASAVKVIVAPQAQYDALSHKLLADASDRGYVSVSVTAATDRLHLVQHFFFAIARQIDWYELSKRHALAILDRSDLDVPVDGELSLNNVAAVNGLSAFQLNVLLQKRFSEVVFRNPNYSRTFKWALAAMLAGAIDSSGEAGLKRAQVIEWLSGRPADLKVLRQLNITRRINRQNARSFVLDAARWLRDLNLPGLVVSADVSRYCTASMTTGNRYTPAAALDLYEMLRQFIDTTEAVSGMFLMFLFTEEFLSDRRRGLGAYVALKMRLADDVYDTSRPNLMAPLLKIANNDR